MTETRKEMLTKGPQVIEYLRKEKASTLQAHTDAMIHHWTGVLREAHCCGAVTYSIYPDYKS